MSDLGTERSGRRKPTRKRLCKPYTGINIQHRAIRAELSAMAPRRAIEYILSFELPQDEATCIIECDVRGRSCVQVAQMLHLSVDGLAKLRHRAYKKIASEQKGSADV